MVWLLAGGGVCAVPGHDAALAAALNDGMDGDDRALLQDADLVGGAVDLDGPTPCGGPSQVWGCGGGQLAIFAFVLWPRVDAWLGC